MPKSATCSSLCCKYAMKQVVRHYHLSSYLPWGSFFRRVACSCCPVVEAGFLIHYLKKKVVALCLANAICPHFISVE